MYHVCRYDDNWPWADGDGDKFKMFTTEWTSKDAAICSIDVLTRDCCATAYAVYDEYGTCHYARFLP